MIRPHWRPFARALGALPMSEYERRQAAARATVRDNGVTYNVYDDSAGQARPWELDIVPFILSPGDWKVIEAAVIQRAQLAELVLRDAYGPQQLIRTGILPPQLVTGHPQFLRPLSGVTPAGEFLRRKAGQSLGETAPMGTDQPVFVAQFVEPGTRFSSEGCG